MIAEKSIRHTNCWFVLTMWSLGLGRLLSSSSSNSKTGNNSTAFIPNSRRCGIFQEKNKRVRYQRSIAHKHTSRLNVSSVSVIISFYKLQIQRLIGKWLLILAFFAFSSCAHQIQALMCSNISISTYFWGSRILLPSQWHQRNCPL